MAKKSRDDELPNSKDIVVLKQELQRLRIELKRTAEGRDMDFPQSQVVFNRPLS